MYSIQRHSKVAQTLIIVSNALGASAYPFVALVALHGSRMVVIDRFEGKDQVLQLKTHLARHVTRLDAQYATIRAEREERRAAQRIREQQDQAFLASLRADEEKKRRLKEEKEKQKQKELEEQRKLNESMTRLQLKLAKREQLRANFPAEPSDEDPSQISKISIRLPNGKRVTRRFNASDPVQLLADFVDIQDLDPIPPEADFEIVNSYPRRVISDFSQSIQEAGLFPSAALIIEQVL